MARVSRWDRPGAPRDGRWFVRLFGKILIGTGLLMFGFVTYQLWGTGIEYARAQDRLGGELDQLMATTIVAPPPTSPTSPATTSTSTAVSVPALAPVSASTSTSTSTSTTSTSTSTTLAPTTTTTIPSIDLAPFDIQHGQALGRLDIAAIGIENMEFVAGVDLEDLAKGPGAYPETPLPGMYGNAAIAGHRTTHGQPFFHLDELAPGDQITVTMFHGGVYTYSVTGTEVVDPSDRHVIDTVDPTVATLTLTTCTPAYSAAQRLIIHAQLDPAVSSPVFQTVRYWGHAPAAPTAALPGADDPTVTTAAATTTAPVTVAAATTTVAVESAPSVLSTSSTSTSTTVAPTYTTAPSGSLYAVVADDGSAAGDASPAAGPADRSVRDDQFGSQDAFDQGWFHDRSAIPQVIAWALLCAGVVVASYQLAKRYRNSIAGFAVGLVPFVVGLYFFYENVNRLLPAAL